MGRRTDIDWDVIERDYRIGQFSMRELARRHRTTAGSISRRAAKHEWVQDYSAEVREKTRAGLIEKPKPAELLPERPEEEHDASSEKRNTQGGKRNTPTRARNERNTPTPEDIDLAVQTNIAVVNDHRRLLARTRGVAMILIRQLEELRDPAKRAEIVETIEEETSTGTGRLERRRRMLRAIDAPARAQTLASIAHVLAKIIPLERQAFGLDEPDVSEKSPWEQLREELNGTGFHPVG